MTTAVSDNNGTPIAQNTNLQPSHYNQQIWSSETSSTKYTWSVYKDEYTNTETSSYKLMNWRNVNKNEEEGGGAKEYLHYIKM